jgi:cytochrome c-type biogenesis protein CcmF
MALVPFLSWRGEAPGTVARKGAMALGVGVLGAGVAFAAGARGARDLLLILFAVAAAAANLETIVLFVKRKAISSMGGYLAHVGTGVMLVGILVSGVYEHKQTVTLPRGEPTQVGRHTMTFNRTVYATDDGAIKTFAQLDAGRLADRRAKQAMEVEIASPSGKVWKAYPKMYVNQRTNQLMANPDVDSSPLMDLYISPQSYDPGSPAHAEGTVVGLKKGEAKTVFGVNFKFLEFEADRSQIQSERPRVTVTAHYLVTTATQSAEQVARYVMYIGQQEGNTTESPETPIPGTNGRFKVRRTSATDGTSEIEVLGLNPAGDMKPATPESFSMDVTTKPLISLVWGGFYVMMAGGLIALFRRGKETRRAVIAQPA